MSTLPKVTIGIPAHNEEASIGYLLGDIVTQDQSGYAIDRIIVVSDGSTDKTVKIVEKFNHPLITLVKRKKREGVANAVNTIFEQAKGDALVFLNADVAIRDPQCIQKLIEPIMAGRADLVSCCLEELPAKKFIERILYAGMQYKKSVFSKYQDGQNLYTCHGPVRAFSRKLYRKMHFQKSIADDMYSYLFAMKSGFSYIYVEDAVVWYKLPETLRDHWVQSVRFFRSSRVVDQEFSKQFAEPYYRLPRMIFLKDGLRFLFRYPIRLPLYVILTLATSITAFCQSIKRGEEVWQIASSSKKLH